MPRDSIRNRLPYVTAIVGLAPGAAVDLVSGSYLIGSLGAFLVICNVYALRKLPNVSFAIEAAILLSDSFAAALTALQCMRQGTQGLHIVWWIASVAFLMALVVLWLKKQRTRHSVTPESHTSVHDLADCSES